MFVSRFRYLIPIFVWITVCSGQMRNQERILTFNSSLSIHKNGELHVKELITVMGHGITIRHGIFRDFPTVYFDTWGFRHKLIVHINQTLLDGLPVTYHQEYLSNGERFFIGDKALPLKHGVHTYTIEYTVANPLFFDNDYAVFYWNVIGTGWKLPIEHATVSLEFPTQDYRYGLPQLYTGYEGQRELVTIAKRDATNIMFETKQPLLPGQGVTIRFVMDSSVFIKPDIVSKFSRFVIDNLALIWLGIVFLCQLFFYCWKWHLVRPYQRRGTIIPRFYPPALSPAGVRFLYKRLCDATSLAATVVGMAVKGFLIIEADQKGLGWWRKRVYTLKRAQPLSDSAFQDYKLIYRTLFSRSSNVTVGSYDQKSKEVLAEASHRLSNYCYDNYMDSLIVTNIEAVVISVILSAIALVMVPLIAAKPEPISSEWFFIAILLFGGLHLLFAWLLRSYTKQGRQLVDEIEGFKLFLTTTETERMAMMGTPP
ncbi:MAG TPA: DUF2207 domain-containing protein, partial [Candidatus Babeliaceae bacterium]|nr:DUF2207 domain-containing protein [Candidatus Babeliaceae bacterium]